MVQPYVVGVQALDHCTRTISLYSSRLSSQSYARPFFFLFSCGEAESTTHSMFQSLFLLCIIQPVCISISVFVCKCVYSRVPWVCLYSRTSRTEYYDIAIVMCITAHVVKLLLLCSFRTAIIFSSLLFSLRLDVFLFSLRSLFCVPCVIHLFLLSAECSPCISSPQHRHFERGDRKLWAHRHSHTKSIVHWFVVFLVRARKTLLQIQWFCSTWYLKYHYYNYSRLDRAARNTHRYWLSQLICIHIRRSI